MNPQTSVGDNSVSQTENPLWIPDVLVLGPGGIKGLAILGALVVLEAFGYLERVHTYTGVSVGSIVCLLIVCGCPVKEIIAEATDNLLFQDLSCINFSDMRKNIGLISNGSIKQKLTEIISKKFGFVPTLDQLYRFTGLGYTSVTLNVDHEEVEYLSYLNNPDMSCIDAAMLSMNIPFLFYKIKYNDCIYADGALGNPYPVDYHDDGINNVLGISVTGGQPEGVERESVDSSGVKYLFKIIQSTMTQLRKRIEKGASERCRHLRLVTNVMDVSGLTVTVEAKANMVISGYNKALEFVGGLKREGRGERKEGRGEEEKKEPVGRTPRSVRRIPGSVRVEPVISESNISPLSVLERMRQVPPTPGVGRI